MLDKKEKMIMTFIFDGCVNGKTHLFSAQEMIDYVTQKHYVLSLTELDEIMISLSKENLIDYVQTESKTGNMYCVTLKSKGQVFKKDLQKEKRRATWLILRTALLAIFSFIIGVLLRAIF